jgi:hypothetical protein
MSAIEKPRQLATGRASVGFSVKSSPQSKLKSPVGQTPRYVRWPVKNDDGHVVGHELLKISPELQAYIARMAMGARS